MEILTVARDSAAAAAAPNPGAPPPGVVDLPLSYGQRALWFLDRLAPGNPAYVIAGAARVRGELDVAALKRAAAALALRHPALRVTFLDGPAGPRQRISESLEPSEESAVDFLEEDGAGLDEAALARRLSELAYRPFDLSRGPLWRLALVRLAGGEHGLALSVHHVVSDFWSLGVMIRDLGALYGAEVGAAAPAGAAPLLPPPADLYAQLVHEEASSLGGPAGEALWEHWRTALAGMPRVLALPTDHPRPAGTSHRRGSRSFALPPATAAALGRLTRRRGATLYMGLLAAFEVLLLRYSGEERLVVGCPTSGRKTAELAGLVAYLVNPVPIATDLSDDPSFAELLGRVRAAALAAFAHRDYPLQLLAERLQPEREVGTSPIFQVMCVLQKSRRAEEEGLAALSVGEAGVPMAMGPLDLVSISLAAPGAQFDLSLGFAETARGLSGRLGYDRDLFEAATAARMAGHLGTLLTALASGSSAERSLSDLPLLSAAEAHQLLVEWRGDGRDYPGSELLHELFTEQVALRPDEPALWYAGQWQSYGELDRRADRVALRLQALGVGPEKIVGLCLTRSFDLVAGVIGLLKSGATYLPLDPDLPTERLSFLIADAGVAALVVEGATADLLPASAVPRLRVEDALKETASAPPPARPARPAVPPPMPPMPAMSPDHPAYIIYTSGSTGRPKGVVISHRAISARMRFACTDDLHPGERMLQRATLSFDVSIFELFGPFMTGGQLILPPPGSERDPSQLLSIAAEHGITRLSLPPVLLSLILEREALPALPALRMVATGGETVPPDLPSRFHARMQAHLENRYGPTETTISVTAWRSTPGEEVPARLPIGRPVAVSEIYLLGPGLAPVPMGVPGELCIGGPCLARGYLGRPELTAEKFVPDPYAALAGRPGERLYRTGDVVRHRTDGAIEFLGRIDGQVKVRGFRVELGEIEAALLEQPEIQSAAVADRDDPGTGSRRLVAWIVVQPTVAGTPGITGTLLVPELRARLGAKLPAYMVPAAFVLVPALPLMVSGKVDRKALPEPVDSGEERAGEASYEAPCGPVEELLAEIWSDLLGVQRIGRRDGFFDLGGHSLLATRLVSQVRETLGIELPLRAVFEAPTLAAFAAFAGVAAAASVAGSGAPAFPAPPLRPALRSGPLPLSFAQERLWFLDRLEPGLPLYNMAGAYRLSGRLDRQALAASLTEIVRRHEALRTVFPVGEERPEQVVGGALPVDLPGIDLTGLGGKAGEAEERRLAAEEAVRPFDLARGPLLRVRLLALAADEHALLLTLHHIAADGGSIDVLIRELAALYGSAGAGRRASATGLPAPPALPALPALPELPVQYADFALWQRSYLAGETLERELAYWRQALAGVATLDLPTDRPRPPRRRGRGRALRSSLSPALSHELERLSRGAGTTLFMTFVAAFATLLGRHAGREDVSVGTPIANRGQREIEGLIGLFVNTLVLRVDASGRPTFRQLLTRVRSAALAAFAHQEVPFEKVVEALQPERDPSRTPLFEVMLVLQSPAVGAVRLPGLSLAALPVDSGTAKFDLNLSLRPRAVPATISGTPAAGFGEVWEYDVDLFDPTTVERLADRFSVLLAGAVADPDAPLAELPLLTAAERQALLEWNGTAAAYPVTPTLHDLIAAQTRRTPDAAAVTFEAATLSYGELGARAARLAVHLQGSGVGPDVVVGVAVERSLDLMLGLCGVLAAGGAYLPLDSSYPRERLARMLEDARPPVVLTQARTAALLPDHPGRTVLLDAPWGEEGEQGHVKVLPWFGPHPRPLSRPTLPTAGRGERSVEEAKTTLSCLSPPSPGGGVGGSGEGGRGGEGKRRGLAPTLTRSWEGEISVGAQAADPENLAYVIFTSGSTGRPKGAMCTHRGIVNRLLWMQEAYGLGASDRVLQKTPVSFDVSVWELFWPLTVGACLVVALPGGHQDPVYLARTLAEREITTAHFVPAMLQAFLDEPEVERTALNLALRQVMASGEALPAALAERFLARFPGVALHNLYGPTEAAVDVTYHPCAPGETVVPIGRPVANTLLRVLDAELSAVPVGVAGELYIGGIQLARGYLGRAELTAERFLPDALALAGDAAAGARLYRTGDLARHLPGGEIEYLGRLDHQVKIRGQRIELGEIETALLAHPAVRAAVVVVREETGERRLVGYLVAGLIEDGDAPTVPELRAALAAVLPEPMIPAAFVFLDALPRNANGKLDRRALPAPEWQGGATHVAPRTEVEALLAGIWEEILGRDGAAARVGVEDNFFALGGHSLLATRVVARIRQVLDVELPLRTLFDRPTVSSLALAVTAATAAAAGKAGQSEMAPPLVRRAPEPGQELAQEVATPLSFAQERLWFLDQLEPGSAAYNVPVALRLSGRLAAPVLAASFAEIVRRHEALRTTFALREDRGRSRPVQRVAPDLAPALTLPAIDLRGLPERRRRQEAGRLVAFETGRPFDLGRGPLLRLARFVLTGDGTASEELLLLNLHHIVADGWSLGVLVAELGTLYRAGLAGEPSPLPELPLQYPDFALWQRRWLSGPVLAREITWWREALAGLPQLDLPTDFPRPARRSGRGALHRSALPPARVESLSRLARAEGGTLFMVLLTGLAALLSRLTGATDVAVGSPLANRTYRETEDLIGFFVNTLVFRMDLGGDPQVGELLGRVRRSALAAYAHQDLPFDKVVEALAPERDPARTPLFSVLLSLQNAPREALELPELTFERVELDRDTAKFDLTWNLTESASGLEVALEYNRDLFEPATAVRLSGHFAVLLGGMAGDVEAPRPRLADLPLLSLAERHQLVVEWSAGLRGETAYPREGTVHGLFTEQAARRPDTVAVTSATLTLSYRELGRRAGRLARRLAANGVGPEVVVGFFLEDPVEKMLAMLAVLLAGGAYVPLDPAYPLERLAYFLEDTAAPVVVTETSLEGGLPEGTAARLLLDGIEEGEEPIISLPAMPVMPAASAETLAYVMYTSGSTGKPKGVAVSHQAVVRTIRETDFVQFVPGDRVAALSNTAFDAAVFEIWGALVNGATLVVVDRETALVPERLAAFLTSRQVSTLFLTTALFNQVARGAPGAFRSLTHLLSGGEAVDPSSFARVLAAGGPARLLHMYGPTENAIFSTWNRITAVPPGAATLPIGGSVANSAIHVLDPAGSTVAIGVPGELYLGGEGLARGYFGLPGRTAEAFVPSPFGRPGDRLYRTGDLVRLGASGAIEFLGRIDGQVKIRGYRIEPGEIEAALLAEPGVVQAAVLVRQEGAERRLVAYVAIPGARTTGTELRASLRERLPEYMLPAAFVIREVLPINPNGKIDRRALAAIEITVEAAAGRHISPRTELEARLAEIWAEVLGLDQKAGGVGMEDDFFALGGHSLLATSLVSRVRQACGVEVTLRQLFARPTVAGLAAEVEAVLSVQRAVQRAGLPPLVAGARKGPLPLSFPQERLWFLDRLDRGSPAYNVPAALRLRGRLDAPALASSFNTIVRRHEALRTTFSFPDNAAEAQPVQVVSPGLDLPLPRVDLDRLPTGKAELELQRLVRAEVGRGFDLARGPLLRTTLLRLAADEHVLLFTMHHIVSDGWSLEVLIRELGALYGSARSGLGGRPSPLPDLTLQYGDYALWQRAYLTGEVLARQLSYWRETLGGMPTLDLPTDRPRPPRRRGLGGAWRFRLAPEVSRGLARHSRASGNTVFMTLLASLSALLSRYTGQDDVALGTVVANRTRREIEGLIGFFVNTLVLRCRPGEAAKSFGDLLAAVRATALAAYAHQDVPFERVVEELSPRRDPSRTPLFQVLLLLQNAGRGTLTLPGLAVERIELPAETAKFDLTLALFEDDEGLSGGLEYDRDLFDVTTVARFASHFETLLAGALETPGAWLAELPLLSAEERAQLARWSAGPALPAAPPELQEGCLHELFFAQARRTPGAEALVWGEERLSYGDLAGRAERLARVLRSLGVGPETRVAVCLARTPALPVALLAVLAAGGAYVPLDPQYPAERLRLMLADSGARWLVTQEDLSERLPAEAMPTGCQVIFTDRAPMDLSASGSAILPRPANLAYLIYTSGSTGTPKGVAITHRSAVARVRWAREIFPAADLSGVLFATSVCFDLSIFELFVPLSWGGRVILADDALALPRLAAREEVRLVNTVPSAMAELVRQGVLPLGVRTVNLAGERLPGPLVEALYRLPQIERVWNLYGPSEDTTYSTGALQPRGDGLEPRLEPGIGRPLPGTVAQVLDRTGVPVPAGIPGELFLGGAGLARGYFGNPERTAERFVPDPFAVEPGGRLYRTGDLVRYRPAGRDAGELQILGRIDGQVKVRGFRVEPGEIEAVLGRHPEVREVAVTAREDTPGDLRLVAYIVPAGPGAAGELTERLRAHVAERLPAYLVPAAFVILPALPLSANGKVDRRALPAPEWQSAATHVAPRTEIETLLAGIWEEILGRERVGIEDDFFALGGHSLLATRVISHVRQACGVEISLHQLFARPTVAGLAVEVEAALVAGGETLPPLVAGPEGRPGELPLSFAQERLWFLDQFEPGSPAYNIPAALRLRGRLDAPALAASFHAIVSRHEALRTTFSFPEGEGEEGVKRPVQVIAPRLALPLPQADLAGLPPGEIEAELHRLVRDEVGRGFDLARGPLLRTTLLRLAADEHVLLCTMHHIVSDGWSIEVLIRELGALYAGARSGMGGRPSPLPDLALQYGDYSLWQRTYLSGEVLARQLAYWREALAGLPTLDLPTDRPRPPRRRSLGGVWRFRLSPEVSHGLARQSRVSGSTLFMTLLAGFSALLSRYTGQDDLAIGTAVANRTRREIEGLIGFFVNTLVLRRLSGETVETFAALLAMVRATALGAYAHQDVPFERVVEELSPRRDPSRTPLFQVMLLLQNAGRGALTLPGLAVEQIALPSETAKFDLTLALAEEDEGLAGAWEYDRDLFDAPTVARLASHFETLLAGALGEPGARLAELPLLSPEEREQLARWSAGPAVSAPLPELQGGCLHELFLAQARRTPAAEALVWGEERLDYGDLAGRAERLARVLRSFGVGPEERVAVCLARTPALPVALLAVLAAGGAYVPLDPSYPAERLRLMLADSGARWLLTQPELAERLSGAAGAAAVGCQAIFVDRSGLADELRIELPEPSAAVEPVPENLAYLIYTSGSTGTPKGVAIAHRSAVARVRWARETFPAADLSGVLFATSVCFDLSIFELFVPLSWGGRVILADDALALPRLAAREEVRLINTVPSAMAELVRQGEIPSGVRTVNLAGERLPGPLVEALHRLPQIERVWNLYGPSEDTTYSTAAFQPRNALREPGIGRPLPGTLAHVLDRAGNPVPAGVPGELYLGGAGLARGYFGNPERTAERFVPDPFGAEPGGRLYRTGDLVRYRSAELGAGDRGDMGDLVILGRIDGQVKVRGFRIEPGEIEAVLSRHPGVREVAVTAREDTPGDLRLVAYVVPAGDEVGLTERLRAHVAERLPAYLVPAAFVILPALPLSANGKVDRRALPAPEWQGAAIHVAPRTPVETVLADLWCQVLGCEKVGVTDDFFRLGGHSLLATRLIARVRGTFRVDIPVRQLFEKPTVETLAKVVVGAEEKPGQSERIARVLLRLKQSRTSRTSRTPP